jgi:hypothetical protein
MSSCRHATLCVISYYLRTDKYELPVLHYFIYCAEDIIKFLYCRQVACRPLNQRAPRIGVLYEPVVLVC